MFGEGTGQTTPGLNRIHYPLSIIHHVIGGSARRLAVEAVGFRICLVRTLGVGSFDAVPFRAGCLRGKIRG